LRERYPQAAAELAALSLGLLEAGDVLGRSGLAEVQEIFTRCFDVQPVTTLSVGYIMFGDDYKRGELMVHLRREQRAAGVDCGNELPDHLPNILRLLAVWPDRVIVEEFVTEILHPALVRMLAEFDVQRTAQRERLYLRHFKTVIAVSTGRATLFARPLRALLSVLRSDFPLDERAPSELDNAFLRSVVQELELEADEGRPARRGG
jgi:nitrate reductase assembly molybdenum cofactor insertion protein NarJ